MKRKIFSALCLAILSLTMIVPAVFAHGGDDGPLDKVRDATQKFRKLSRAQAAGYALMPGLDTCFDNPGVGGMGYHYINGALLDATVNARKPEAMVYASRRNGRLELVAVEYIVDAAAWDAGHSQPPSLFGRTFQLNTTLGVYTLHAWIWKRNPLGVFADWNPGVSCP
jgi:hypothetical protein